MNLPTTIVKTINKHISRASKNYTLMRDNLIDFYLLCKGYVGSFSCDDRKNLVEEITLSIASDRDIVINLLGCIDLRSDMAQFPEDLNYLRKILSSADFSFATSRFGKHSTPEYAALSEQLDAYRINDVAKSNQFIHSALYKTRVGTVAVCACMMSYKSASKHQVRVELVQEYHMLKRMGADYVIMYIDSKQMDQTTDKNKQLNNLLLKAGVDYIVNVKPNILDSGVTYRQKNGSVSRAVYSAGTFLANRDAFPDGRIALRVKLRNVNGKLQAFEESYYPLRYFGKNGLRNLIHPGAPLSKESIGILSKIEASMPRLRRVDRILHVGTIMDLIGAELPANYAYLRDFSVGKVRARSFEVKPGDIFFFREQFNDANDLQKISERAYLKVAKTANKRGALLLISYRKLPFSCASVLCDKTIEAHIAVCAYLRRQFATKTISITGSIGKTSTKDMLAEVMKMRYLTVKSEHNTNVQVWIGENIQKLTSSCEMFIQETGGGRPGGASRHARMVLPEVTVITNIGDAHLGNFNGDQTALMNNKLGIIDGMPKNGVLFLNADDPLLVNAQPNCNKILFAVHNHNADFYADNIRTDGNKTTFEIVHSGRKVPAKLNVPGEHNVLNAVCAFAIGKHYGIPEKSIVTGISNFKTQGIRQNIVHACGMKLFLDCFNASSGSVESSIKTLRQIKIPAHGKRIAVIGDITGLGDLAVSTHKEIAHVLIENPADLFLFYGTNTKYTYDIVKAAGFEAFYTAHYDTLCQLLETHAKPGDAIMAKGSSKMRLEYAFDCAFGTRSFDSAMLEEGAYFRTTTGKVTYNLFTTHATAVRPAEGVTYVQIRKNVGVVAVRSIATTFSSPTLETVLLPDSIRHIGLGAFRDCKNLKQVDGATALKYVGMAAFKNCSRLESITLPETLLHIGNEAFSGCTALKELYIPESVAQIGPNAFANCPDLKITCKAGSYAESYLQKYKISYSCK